MKIGERSGQVNLNLTRYMEQRERRLWIRNRRDLILFGQVGGVIIALVSFMRWISGTGRLSLLWEVGVVLGVFLFAVGLFAPMLLQRVYNGVGKVGNYIGILFFRMILIAVYVFFVLPVSLLFRFKREGYNYVIWENNLESNVATTIIPWNYKDIGGNMRNGIRGTIYEIISEMIYSGRVVLLPVIVILLLLGLMMFFVSSSIVAPFIYTLF